MRHFKLYAIIVTLALALLISASAIAGENTGIITDMDKTSNATLVQLLKDDNLGIRTSAAQVLGDRKAVEAVEPLQKMLKKDKKYQARIIAGVTLLQIGDNSSMQFIREQALKDKNKTVRSVLAGVVNRMQEQYLANR